MAHDKMFAGVLLAAAMGCATGALAAEADGKWVVGVSGGTLGIGPEIGYRYGAHAGVRASAGFLNFDHSEEIDDIDYDGKLKLGSVGLVADWYPFGGSFRLSAGARSNSNKIDLLAAPTATQTYEIGDRTYTGAQIGTLAGDVKFNKFSPSLTLGWGGKLADGFTVGFEAGVLFQGAPEINLAATGGLLANDPTFRAEVEKERLQAEDDAKDFKFWPVLQLHLLYRF
jgi:hypothetical protein